MLSCPECHEHFDDEILVCPNDGSELDIPSDSRLGMVLPFGVTLRSVAGSGAMGTVYEGWQETMDRRVAVKMLHGDLARESEFVERFLREAKAVARLNHPNIITIHSVGEHGDRPYLVMEFIDGATVSEAIKAGSLTIARTLRIARQITSALADAHAGGIIHRDLKPSNVLLSQRRRANDFVKILDFGVAKIIDADSQLTRDGFVFGTPAYLSPEQANGTHVDGRADLYSFGVMLYEMLTGELPFTGNQVQLLLAHAKERAPSILVSAPKLDPRLAALVDALLEKDPNDRPDSAETVADALDQLIGGGMLTPWASMALPAAEQDLATSWTVPEIRSRKSNPKWSTAAQSVETTEAAVAAAKLARPKGHPILLGFAGLALLVAGAGAVAFGPLRDHLPDAVPLLGSGGPPVAEVALPTADPDRPSEPLPELRTDVPRDALMFSVDGYSLRVLRPRRILVGIYYELTIDIWDPEGEPIDATELTVLFEEPQGERPFPASATTSRGSFSIRRRYDDAGDHSMRIYAPSLDSPVIVHFEVLDPL